MADSIMNAAEALGKLIGESEERKRATIAVNALMNNETAAKLMMDYNELRQKEMMKLQVKEPSKEELEAFQNLMQTEFKKLAENEIVAEYMEANKAYEALVKRVNGVLGYYINGEEPESGCSGSCSSCGGCH